MNAARKASRGSVLIVSLVILLVLTILGMSGMNTTVMQERMAGNMQEAVSAFQAAESGLRDGEIDTRLNLNPTSVFTSACTGGLCEPADPAVRDYDVWADTGANSVVQWDAADASKDRNTRDYGEETNADALQNISDRSRQPAYIVERLQVVDRAGSIVTGFANQPQAEWYRVTSRGFGRNGQSQAAVQSVVRK